jgi:hypothetical protein
VSASAREDEQRALADKYREMIALRRATGPKDEARLKQLAARFPGVLREIDSRTMESLEERLAELETGWPAWASLQIRFHGWLRVALRLRSDGATDLDAWLVTYVPREPGDPTQEQLTVRIASLVTPREGRVSLAARDALEAGEVDLDLLLFGRSAK